MPTELNLPAETAGSPPVRNTKDAKTLAAPLEERASVSIDGREYVQNVGQSGPESSATQSVGEEMQGPLGAQTQIPYRLYKQRFVGMIGIIVLNIVAALSMPWFGPISNDTAKAFGISLDQVNWLGNIVGVTYLVVAPIIPVLCSRYGIRVCFFIATAFLIVSAWVRYAGTADSLTPRGAYALLIIGQLLSAIPQIAFQVLVPKFSETWFDLKGRTTATMVMSISNPVGGALGQLISPSVSNPRASVLVLGIISTAVSPFVLLISSKPPTPPSYAGSQPSPPFLTTLRAILGLLPRPTVRPSSRSLPAAGEAQEKKEQVLESLISPVSTAESRKSDRIDVQDLEDVGSGKGAGDNGELDYAADEYMTPRERVDFVILFLIFGVLVGGINTFSLLSDEILEPYGYSSNTAGFMGAALLLSGLVAAFATAPLFDRILTHHLGLAARIFAPLVAASWLALIWAVRPDNAAALYALFVVIGVFSLSMLPVGLELGCELTRNSGASAAILWFSGNLFGIIFILVMSALRASASASPPLNMHRALIFNGTFIFAATSSVFLFHGRQRRRENDARAAVAMAAGWAHGEQPESLVYAGRTEI